MLLLRSVNHISCFLQGGGLFKEHLAYNDVVKIYYQANVKYFLLKSNKGIKNYDINI